MFFYLSIVFKFQRNINNYFINFTTFLSNILHFNEVTEETDE